MGSGLEKKIHQYHHTWLQTSVMFPDYATIKSGPGTYGGSHIRYGQVQETEPEMTGSHSVHQISGLFPFLWLCYHGIPAVLIFSTPIYLTETGTILLICFCYYYEFIITITLSI